MTWTSPGAPSGNGWRARPLPAHGRNDMIDARPARFSPTVMHAFRAAFKARDSRKHVDMRDESGERIVAPRRLPHRYGARETILKEELARDLSALLNTVSLSSSLDLSDRPDVAASVLAFGIDDPAVAGTEEGTRRRIAGEIARRIATFEPRILADTLKVVPRPRSDAESVTAMSFTVEGEVRAVPVNIGVEFVADLDPLSRAFSVKRLALR